MERRWFRYHHIEDWNFKLIWYFLLKRASDDFFFSLIEEKDFESSKSIIVSEVITLDHELSTNEAADFQLLLSTDCSVPFTLSLAYDLKPMSVEVGIGFGAAVLVGLYVLIISEVVDRTFAALIASSLSIAALALFNERPNLEEIVSWIDMDTLMLLFGMMILVAITSETGCFDYMAVFVFKVFLREFVLSLHQISNTFNR